MSVRVRLTRVGSNKNPVWRVVVADQRSPRDGRIIESIGHYNPQTQPSTIVIDRERLEHWIERGAQPTNTVRKLMRAPDTQAATVATQTTGAEFPAVPTESAPDAEKPAEASEAEAAAGDAEGESAAPEAQAAGADSGESEADVAGAGSAADTAAVEGGAAPAEDESAPAEDESAPAEGEPASGGSDSVPAEGESAPDGAADSGAEAGPSDAAVEE